MFYYLDTECQIKRISKSAGLFQSNTEHIVNEELLRDITDGLLYKNILNSSIGNLIKNRDAFTLTLNTDGISLSENSALSMWPVYTVINEIKPGERFCIDNVIISGKILFFKLCYRFAGVVISF